MQVHQNSKARVINMTAEMGSLLGERVDLPGSEQYHRQGFGGSPNRA
ncbi:MAG: hypothetical protein Q6L60_07845 [Thermostichus sp. HHBFW_bins_43]